MEMKTIETPITKLSVNGWPKRAALINPVRIVAIVDEYFFRIVSANLKKKLDRIPWKALFTISANVTVVNPANRPL